MLKDFTEKNLRRLDQTVNLLANKDIVVENYILNVKQRDGNSLAGIRIVRNDPDGKETIITSNTSTVMQGPPNYIETASENSKDHDRLKVVVIHNSLNLTLFNALVQTKSQSGTTRLVVKRMDLNF